MFSFFERSSFFGKEVCEEKRTSQEKRRIELFLEMKKKRKISFSSVAHFSRKRENAKRGRKEGATCSQQLLPLQTSRGKLVFFFVNIWERRRQENVNFSSLSPPTTKRKNESLCVNHPEP